MAVFCDSLASLSEFHHAICPNRYDLMWDNCQYNSYCDLLINGRKKWTQLVLSVLIYGLNIFCQLKPNNSMDLTVFVSENVDLTTFVIGDTDLTSCVSGDVDLTTFISAALDLTFSISVDSNVAHFCITFNSNLAKGMV